MEGRFFPIAGIVIALATGSVMIFAGTNPWLVAAATLVWVGSFWLGMPPPPPAPPSRPLEGVQLTRTGMRDLLEHSGLPMLMLSRHSLDKDEQPVEWVRSVYRGDRYKFVARLKRPQD